MGFMTEISILNDAWHAIKKNPEQLVEAIEDGMDGEPGESHGIHDGLAIYANPITTYPSHHADVPRLYLAWRNSFVSLNFWDLERELSHRLDKPEDYIFNVLEQDLKEAQRIITRTRKMLKEKKAARQEQAA